VRPQEHYSEAQRLASKAEAERRAPGQPFNPEPWLKAQVHATLALYGLIAAAAGVRRPARTPDGMEPIPGEAE
jgi:hypothetical protein